MDPVTPEVPPIALCLGGMDPSGGAGILRDALTVAALGCHPMAISLAETLQNGVGCSRIEPPSMDPVSRLESLALHLTGRWGVKVGLCALDSSVFHRLCAALTHLAPPVRIWDPILAPSAGVGLHDGGDLRRLASALLPTGGWVVSPNRGEAAAFAGLPPEAIRTAEVEALARPWLEAGAEAVWLKGGHAEGDRVQDFWITSASTEALEASPRLSGARRGTGCTLASAWLALRLRGLDPKAAALESAHRLRSRWARAWVPGGAGRPVLAPEVP